jgi:kinesin family protein 2/24
MGNAESNPVRNMDKRTARREYRDTFAGAIARYRAIVSSEDLHAYAQEGSGTGSGDMQEGQHNVSVCVRKRPIFQHEIDDGEFDVITTIGGKKVVVHDARMHADMKRQFLYHYEFNFDHVFGEKASNRDVYNASAAPLVESALQGGYATCLMYGQTGSGSKSNVDR